MALANCCALHQIDPGGKRSDYDCSQLNSIKQMK